MGMMIHRHKIRAATQAALFNAEQKKDIAAEAKDIPVMQEAAFEVKEEKRTYSRTDIAHLTTAQLQELAEQENIKNANKLSGVELKKVLIKHFGL